MPGVRLQVKGGPIMAPTGYTTLASAVDDLARSGFREQFRVRGGKLLALHSGKAFNAAELVIRAYHRFEGVSDPDDMAIVYAVESSSGVQGTLVDAFGVYADPALGEFLEGVPIREVAQRGSRSPARQRRRRPGPWAGRGVRVRAGRCVSRSSLGRGAIRQRYDRWRPRPLGLRVTTMVFRRPRQGTRGRTTGARTDRLERHGREQLTR
jgi:hypothetical protein